MEKNHPQKCNLCEKAFSKDWNMSVHYKHAHNMTLEEGLKVARKVQCFVCAHVLQQSALKDHMEKNHYGLHTYFKTVFNDDKEQCEKCGKFFKLRIMKEQHMKKCIMIVPE